MTEDSETHDWYSEDTATFGDRIAAAREAAGMSQKQLAERIGVSTKTLRGWEDDMNEPRANRWSMLAGILGVTLSWMLTGEGDGILAPDEDPTLAPDMTELLIDLRAIRAQMALSTARLARLEKRLRTMGRV